MSNIQSVKTQIQNLINMANSTTNKQDTDLTTAVSSLVSGYGSGGGSGEPDTPSRENMIDMIDGFYGPSGTTTTDNGDGTLTIDGTVSDTGTLCFNVYGKELQQGGTYLFDLEGMPRDVYNNVEFAEIRVGNDSDIMPGDTFESIGGYVDGHVQIVFREGTTFDNVTFRPVIYEV